MKRVMVHVVRFPRGLYAIADGSSGRPPLALIAAFLEGGAAVVQLRLKDAGARELLNIARQARALCAGRALFLVNDRPDVAKLAGADGVHLGQDDLPVSAAREILGPGKWVGLSTHADAEIDLARGAGADYLGFGPVFATQTKATPLPPPHGLEGLARAVRRAGALPVVAIGGITAANVREVARTGAHCAAAIGELSRAADPAAAARAFAEAFR
jgi:thiamine-phosphate pyrophosphorylase